MKPPLQIAFLTGQSNPGNAALSPLQNTFLDALPVPDEWKVRVNFPYPDIPQTFRRTRLPIASWNNLALYLRSRLPAFAATYRFPVLAQIERAERTLLLAGSSGLELLFNLHLPAAALSRLHVFAYGPVARRLPDCDCRLVQGRDSISRLFFRGDVPTTRVECDHLDYLRDSQVLALCVAYLNEIKAAGGTG
ncbi:MAG TPA: hypothetical protein VGS22_07960 [Thermoanaerobaculia bacterium]|jgi:hypothetical protein|nr:hypothetical protein [Thermoanaerobaculia bacterium]